MAKQWQLRRGTTEENDAFVGAEGEVTVDTTTHELRIHDGTKAGGYTVGSGNSNYHPDLFDVKWADHILNDAEWLRADTFSWQDGTVYQEAYQHLVDDIIVSSITVLNTGTALNETYYRYIDGDITGYYAWKLNEVIIYTESQIPIVGDVAYISISPVKTFEIVEIAGMQHETITWPNGGATIYFYLADDGHKICSADQEGIVTAIYNKTGIAWYYIIDTANQRFKLPRTQFAFTGIRDSIGGYVKAGLPNITGAFRGNNAFNDSPVSYTGAFGVVYSGSTTGASGAGSSPYYFDFDASRSSSIYGNSDTVQPKATQMYLYFYVGNFTQTALENTAGVTTEVLNGKADINLSNAVLSSTFAKLLLDAGIDVVVEKQLPTADNGYTWYRLYKSGWVEQGGYLSGSGSDVTTSLLITMTDSNYTVLFGNTSGSYEQIQLTARTTTTFSARCSKGSGTTSGCWQVSGMAA